MQNLKQNQRLQRNQPDVEPQRLKPIWKGETVVCIASGPSLAVEDIEYIKGRAKVIVINDNYRIAPWADVLYACDLKWWDWHSGAMEFVGEKWTQDKKAAEKYGINYIRSAAGVGLSVEHDLIHTGSNSGFQAINLAYHFGASRVVLTGYDMKIAKSGASHWFGDHPDGVRSNYAPWLLGYKQIANQAAVEVINCTRDTALDMFPIKRIQDVL